VRQSVAAGAAGALAGGRVDLQARRPEQQRGWQRVTRPALKRQAAQQGPGLVLLALR
jgi:hypothetical protein